MDILTTITTQRLLDVAQAKEACSSAALHARVASRYPAAPLCLCSVLAGHAGLAVAAEFKRASPSKGDIVAPGTALEPYGRAYTLGGARIMSVLTEPTWFKGSMEDMEAAREVTAREAASAGLPSRPIILRKDFVLDEYQLLEARAYGADTALLIVASLPTAAVLAPLVQASRALGMEPLVEVNSVGELEVALAAGARVVGINNRNLRTFEVDLGTTTRIVAHAAALGAQVAILSLSGIKSGQDVADLAAECALAPGGRAVMRGFLIGEALMRCASPQALVAELCAAGTHVLAENPTATAAAAAAAAAATTPPTALLPHRLLPAEHRRAKVCGVRDCEAALHAARAGADFVGLILLPGSPRSITSATASAITGAIKAFREVEASAALAACAAAPASDSGGGAAALDVARLRAAGALLSATGKRARPLCVGVFKGQSPAAVLDLARAAGVDVVQLHGSEAAGDFAGFPLPIIKVLHVEAGVLVAPAAAALAQTAAAWSAVAAALLLDSAGGGTGSAFDHSALLPALDEALSGLAGAESGPVPFWLAGGLTPHALPSTLAALGACPPGGASRVWAQVGALDVSSGVEVEGAAKGTKDPHKVSAFVAGVHS